MTTPELAIDGGTPVRATMPPLGKGAALLGEEERAAVLEMLASRSLFRYYGPRLLGRTAAFEAAVSEPVGSGYAVATSNSTAALRTALAASGGGWCSQAIGPAVTFIATVNPFEAATAVP